MNLSVDNIKQKLYKEIESIPNIKIARINTSDICFEERVKLKCFYCNNYNKKWTCPPKIPKVDYQKIIQNEYKEGMIICYTEPISENDFEIVRTRTTNMLHRTLLRAEKFLYEQNKVLVLSFIGGSCKLCKNGCNLERCNNPQLARISMEGAGINVIKTLEKVNLKVEFPIKEELSRYGLLLWEGK